MVKKKKKKEGNIIQNCKQKNACFPLSKMTQCHKKKKDNV